MTDLPEANDLVGAVVPSPEDAKSWLVPPAAVPHEPPPPTPSFIFDFHAIGDDGDALHITPPPRCALHNWKVVGTGLLVICWKREP